MIENSWLFPALEAVHVIALAMLVGSVTLRNLGYATPARVERAGLWLMIATGAAMFAADYGRYARNPAFWVKLGLLSAALLARHPRWSLALWTLTVLAARAVIDFDA